MIDTEELRRRLDRANGEYYLLDEADELLDAYDALVKVSEWIELADLPEHLTFENKYGYEQAQDDVRRMIEGALK